MRFRKWLMIHGPGSVRSVAKTMVKVYNSYKSQEPHLSQDALLKMTLESRMRARGIWGQPALTEEEKAELIREANGDLTKFISQFIHWEKPSLTGFIVADPEVYLEAMEIIKKTVTKYSS
jgi:hypothetical protein